MLGPATLQVKTHSWGFSSKKNWLRTRDIDEASPSTNKHGNTCASLRLLPQNLPCPLLLHFNFYYVLQFKTSPLLAYPFPPSPLNVLHSLCGWYFFLASCNSTSISTASLKFCSLVKTMQIRSANYRPFTTVWHSCQLSATYLFPIFSQKSWWIKNNFNHIENLS